MGRSDPSSYTLVRLNPDRLCSVRSIFWISSGPSLAPPAHPTTATHIRLAFLTRAYNQVTASLTPSPVNALTPSTSRLAILSALAPSTSDSLIGLAVFPPMLSPDTFSPSGLASGSRLSESFKSDSDRARCQASNDSRTSAGESEVGVSCLLARSKSGRFNSLGEVKTVSNKSPYERKRQSQWHKVNATRI